MFKNGDKVMWLNLANIGIAPMFGYYVEPVQINSELETHRITVGENYEVAEISFDNLKHAPLRPFNQEDYNKFIDGVKAISAFAEMTCEKLRQEWIDSAKTII